MRGVQMSAKISEASEVLLGALAPSLALSLYLSVSASLCFVCCVGRSLSLAVWSACISGAEDSCSVCGAPVGVVWRV